MELNLLRDFLMWCSIINIALLVVSMLFIVFARELIYRFHSKWFPMPKETFNVVLYSMLGIYKLGIFLFSVVPYVALVIVA